VPQALTDLGNGAVALMFYPYQPLIPMVQLGKVRLLAATGPKRLSYLPELPTVAESGIAGFTAFAWHGLYAPAGTPQRVTEIVYAALTKTVKDPKVVTALTTGGVDVDLLPPREFAAFTRSEVERYRQIIAMAGAKIE
jgi:tripartite-type tricarboxylate transporter receptor subunit TctC